MKGLPASRLAVVCALIAALALAAVSTLVAGAERPDRPATSPEPGRAVESAPLPGPSGSVAAGVQPPAPSTNASHLTASGKLVVGVVNVDRYPFFYTDASGNLVGSDIDLARDIAHELGVDVTFNRSATTFDGVVDLVAKGQADIGVSKLSITLPRALQARFTRPYIELAQGLLINRVGLTAIGGSDKDIVVFLNRAGRRLGAVTGTSYVGFGHAIFTNADIVEFPDKQSMFAAVLSGDVVAALYDENEIKQYIFEEPDRLINVKVQMLPGHTDPIGIAVGDPQLQYWLNTYLDLKNVKLSVNDLLKKYPRPGSK